MQAGPRPRGTPLPWSQFFAIHRGAEIGATERQSQLRLCHQRQATDGYLKHGSASVIALQAFAQPAACQSMGPPWVIPR